MKSNSGLWLLVGLVIIVAGSLLGAYKPGSVQNSSTNEPGEPPVIISHGVGPGYEGLCLLCHGVGTGEYEFPTEGSNDHTGRTLDQCLTCHEVAAE